VETYEPMEHIIRTSLKPAPNRMQNIDVAGEKQSK
jgi:hypothetical protein